MGATIEFLNTGSVTVELITENGEAIPVELLLSNPQPIEVAIGNTTGPHLLSQLDDVDVLSLQEGDLLRYVGGRWVNAQEDTEINGGSF